MCSTKPSFQGRSLLFSCSLTCFGVGHHQLTTEKKELLATIEKQYTNNIKTPLQWN
jgi:hypothetical protein